MPKTTENASKQSVTDKYKAAQQAKKQLKKKMKELVGITTANGPLWQDREPKNYNDANAHKQVNNLTIEIQALEKVISDNKTTYKERKEEAARLKEELGKAKDSAKKSTIKKDMQLIKPSLKSEAMHIGTKLKSKLSNMVSTKPKVNKQEKEKSGMVRS